MERGAATKPSSTSSLSSPSSSCSLPPTYVPGFHDPDAIRKMRYTPLLGTDMVVSEITLGGSSFSGTAQGPISQEEVTKIVLESLKSGVNMIDTAPWYGQGRSEEVLGKALEGVPRNAYYINTKVGRYELGVENMFDFSARKTRESIEKSLRLLKLDRLDIIQVHDMEFAPSYDIIIQETLPTVQKAVESGKARFIGITGYPLEQFRNVIDRNEKENNGSIRISSVLSYCRYALNDTALLDYLAYFKDKGVGVINAAPVSMGLLAERGPPAWHPAPDHIKKAAHEAAEYCKSKGVNIAKLAVAFGLNLREPPVATCLLSAMSLDIMKENLSLLTDGLSQAESELLEEILRRFFRPLNNANWEGIEVEKYHAKLAARKEKEEGKSS